MNKSMFELECDRLKALFNRPYRPSQDHNDSVRFALDEFLKRPTEKRLKKLRYKLGQIYRVDKDYGGK